MSFFDRYFKYVGKSESPMIYHRWTALSIVGTLLGRQAWIPFGHGVIYPNQYIMLMGPPGARKGTAMNIGAKLLKASGYTRFCADRLSKEQFLKEMRPYDDVDFTQDPDLESLIIDAPFETYALAEEFGDLVGAGSNDFMLMLTKLWDNPPEYKHPKITGKDVIVERPTVNLFGGNTAQSLIQTIPPESLNNGFTSRMIFVHSEATGIRITFPKPADISLRDEIVEDLKEIRETIRGEIAFTDEARLILDRCYQQSIDIEDPRFKYYNSRRFTHLLKLCLVIAAMEKETEITDKTAIAANTILHYTERRMPKALGEFGKNKLSDVANTVVDILNGLNAPIQINALFKKVSRDINSIKDLADILKNLALADRVQVITDPKSGKQGFMPKFVVERGWSKELLNDDVMTEGELS